MDLTGVVMSPNVSGQRAMPPTWVVIHTTEGPETSGAARGVAAMFHNPDADKSTQIVVDDKDTIRCAPDTAICAAAGAMGNVHGLHIEIVGRAGQGNTGWADDYSQAALRRAAAVARAWCDTYGIPVRQLSTADVKAMRAGICGHVNISQAFKQSTHTDPGPSFPWGQFIQLVQGGDDVSAADVWTYKVTPNYDPNAGQIQAQTLMRRMNVKLDRVLAALDPDTFAEAVLAKLGGQAGLTQADVAAAVRAVFADAADGDS